MPSFWENVSVRWRVGPWVLAASTGCLALVAALLSACDAISTGSASLTLYSGQHAETTQAEVSAFERQTGIRVSVRIADENALVQQVEQEGSLSPADLIF